MSVKNKVQLITYPDSMGGDLKTLRHVLKKHFSNTFQGGIHILPPFPSSGDRGFAPLTYLEIDPAFGTWEDIRQLGEEYDILVDLMVNHISGQSEWFRDFLAHGRNSVYADLFITPDKLWAEGSPKQEDLDKMFLRRKLPYSTFKIADTGKSEIVWTTFGKQDPSEQIDLDINSGLTRSLLKKFMENFSRQNVSIVRLDAVGYVVKKPGTSCFYVEPEIDEFMKWIADLADSLGIELLPEVHSHFAIQYLLAEKGYWIYDFILPFFILEALLFKTGSRLCEYLTRRPSRQFTMLDCHDGVPVKPDLDELVSTSDAKKVVNLCLERGANLSLIFSDKHKSPDGFDVHQIRCSYYSALGCNDDAYLTARAIQFFTPGIPQVYYVGLLAGENDTENVKKTAEGREINRHNYTMEEIDRAVEKPVVKRLLRLIRFRNEYPAFNGSFSVRQIDEYHTELSWNKDAFSCSLITDLQAGKSVILYNEGNGQHINYEI
jgi:sucrose 6(F)-phosphate phosphorylase